MLLRALILWLALGFAAQAETLPAPLSDTISDFAGLFSPEDATRIDAALRAGRDDTGVQVVVVTMNSIADHGGADQRIEDYAKALFNQWGVGDSAGNDGILVLVATDDREMRIALGAGYEVIWDNAAQRVIDRDMLPEFREDRYVAGIEAGIAGVFTTIVAPHRAGQPAPEPLSSDEDNFAVIAFFAMLTFACAHLFRAPLGKLALRFRSCPACGARKLGRKSTVLTEATHDETGLLEVNTTCTACGHSDVSTKAISRVQSESSSGGFGGGSSSGGGATGRW